MCFFWRTVFPATVSIHSISSLFLSRSRSLSLSLSLSLSPSLSLLSRLCGHQRGHVIGYIRQVWSAHMRLRDVLVDGVDFRVRARVRGKREVHGVDLLFSGCLESRSLTNTVPTKCYVTTHARTSALAVDRRSVDTSAQNYIKTRTISCRLGIASLSVAP